MEPPSSTFTFEILYLRIAIILFLVSPALVLGRRVFCNLIDLLIPGDMLAVSAGRVGYNIVHIIDNK